MPARTVLFSGRLSLSWKVQVSEPRAPRLPVLPIVPDSGPLPLTDPDRDHDLIRLTWWSSTHCERLWVKVPQGKCGLDPIEGFKTVRWSIDGWDFIDKICSTGKQGWSRKKNIKQIDRLLTWVHCELTINPTEAIQAEIDKLIRLTSSTSELYQVMIDQLNSRIKLNPPTHKTKGCYHYQE